MHNGSDFDFDPDIVRMVDDILTEEPSLRQLRGLGLVTVLTPQHTLYRSMTRRQADVTRQAAKPRTEALSDLR